MHKAGAKPIYDTAKQRSTALYELVQAWRYRDLIIELVRRDVTARYKRSVLGVAWTMLNPLGTMIILSVVFSQIFQAIDGYAAYVLSGLVIWNFFAQTTTSGINALVWGGNLFRRIYVPRTVFAISAVGTGIVNLLLSLIPLFVVMLVIGVPIRPTALLAVVPVILVAVFSLGIALLISSVGIFFQDVVEMYQIFLTAWMYLTPVIYRLSILPEYAQRWVRLNPMVYFVDLFRLTTFYGQLFTLKELAITSVVALASLLIGWGVFAQISDQLAYRA